MNKNITKYNKFLSYKNNNLKMEEIFLEFLAKKINTPIYCYSVSQIKQNFEELKSAFKSCKPLICYAVKANFNQNIIKILADLGAGADVVSVGELKQCMKNGISKKKIVFSGVGKTIQELTYAIKKQIKQINVESEEELEDVILICKNLKKKIDIGLRVNPNVDAQTHKKISTGRFEDKFGIPETKIMNIFNKYKQNSYIKINSISIHIGSQIRSLEPFNLAFKKLRNLIINLQKKSFHIQSIDIGGGVGIVYNEKKDKIFNIKNYVKLIENHFSDFKVQIILEPGRFLVGESGIILSRVIRVKRGENKNFVIIDAGMNNFIRPSLYNSNHAIFPVKKNKRKKKYDVVGPICESSDVFKKNFSISELKQNDLVIISSTGAYGSCMASNYNLREEAKEVLIEGKKFFGI
tara:strand:- start:147 stop:1370 length:1224 start_codon:yes stop_codon:yes gene_type:complete